MQLRLYAKYTDLAQVTQDDSVHTHAICEKKIDYKYYLANEGAEYREVLFFIILALIVPIISMVFACIIVRSFRKNIQVRIAKTVNHQNLVGLVLTGVFVTFYILWLDCAAFYNTFIAENELSEVHHLKKSANYITTSMMLLVDIIIWLMITFVMLLYVCCWNVFNDKFSSESCCKKCATCCLECCLRGLLSVSFTCIFGTMNHKDLWKKNDPNTEKEKRIVNLRLMWIMTLSLVSPILVISSHTMYILVSWLTDTAKASSVALLCLAVMLYLFIMFRQCYMVNAQVADLKKGWSCCLLFYPVYQCCEYIKALCRNCSCKNEGGDDTSVIKLLEIQNEGFNEYSKENENDEKINTFNSEAFCIVYYWGWILVSIMVLVFLAFYWLPIVTFDLLSDLLNTFQVFIILISLLITYKIVSINEPDIYPFLRKLRVAYRENNKIGDKIKNDREMNDVEAAGHIIGKLAKVLVHEEPQQRSEQ
jgi:hypothetical protein